MGREMSGHVTLFSISRAPFGSLTTHARSVGEPQGEGRARGCAAPCPVAQTDLDGK